jgi:Dolichyl-phosphate-mannose-protein mannosyltransferase
VVQAFIMVDKDFLQSSSRRAEWLRVLGILGFALSLRAAYAAFLTNAINAEGAEYARIAENLAGGKGYVGLAVEGRELIFPPFYPILIVGGSFLTGDFQAAAQLVSLVAGVMLLLSVFALARDLYGRAVAYVALLVGAFHPVLIELSATTWVEGLYLALVAAAVYYMNRVQYNGDRRYWILSGAVLSLAYLTCPQAILFPVVFLLALLVVNRSAVTFRNAVLFAGSFIVLAMPYILFISLSTGGVRLEGKTVVNNELGRQLLSGVPYRVASFEVTKGLEEKGVWMRSNEDVAQSSPAVTYRMTLSIILSRGFLNLKQVLLDISGNPIFGAPLILPLVGIGLTRSAWVRHRALGELTLLLVVGASLFAMTTITHTFASRYYYILIPFLIIWASQGVYEVAIWANRTTANLHVPALWSDLSGKAVGGAVCLGLILLLVFGGIRMVRIDRNGLAIRSAGEWLEASPGAKTVMDTSAVTAFHARSKYIPLPWCDSDTALRYVHKKGTNFIVIKSWEADNRPYLRDWLNSGIPAADISLVHAVPGEPGERILIYQVNASSVAQRDGTGTSH